LEGGTQGISDSTILIFIIKPVKKKACKDHKALIKTELDIAQTPATGTEAVLINLTAVGYQNCMHTYNSGLHITLGYFIYALH